MPQRLVSSFRTRPQLFGFMCADFLRLTASGQESARLLMRDSGWR